MIPNHIDILGNVTVDQQAKTLLSLEPTSFKIPFSNFKPSINKYVLDQWQTSWNNGIGNKLLEIKPTIGEPQSVVRNIRKEKPIRSYKSHTSKSSRNAPFAVRPIFFWSVAILHKLPC